METRHYGSCNESDGGCYQYHGPDIEMKEDENGSIPDRPSKPVSHTSLNFGDECSQSLEQTFREDHTPDETGEKITELSGTHENDENATHENDENTTHENDENATHESDDKATLENDQNATLENDQNATLENDQNATLENDENITHENDENSTHENDSPSLDCGKSPSVEPDVDSRHKVSIILECSKKLVDYSTNSSGTEDTSSSTESSTSESSDISESESEVKNIAISDDDGGAQQPPRTKDEVLPQEVPLESVSDVILPENAVLSEMGKLTSIVEGLAVVKAKTDCPALDSGSVLFSKDRRPLGRIFDVFGPVQDPFYSLRVSVEETELLTKDDLLYYHSEIGEYTNFVFVEEVKRMKGSDASWQHDQEPPEEMIEYSDDEEEAKAKAAFKMKKQKERLEKQGPTMNDQTSSSTAPAKQGKHKTVRQTPGIVSGNCHGKNQASNGSAVGPMMGGRGAPRQSNASSGLFRPLHHFAPAAPPPYGMRTDRPSGFQGPPVTGLPRLEQRRENHCSPPSVSQHRFQGPVNMATTPFYPPAIEHMPTRGPYHSFRPPFCQPPPRLRHDFVHVRMEDFAPPNNCFSSNNGPFPSRQQRFEMTGRTGFQEHAFHPRPPLGNNTQNSMQ